MDGVTTEDPGNLRRYLPHLVVFISSMGVMIIELVASRLISKYFGSSLYTWTGIIGVVLGGISLGNFIGGRLADRFSPRNIIAILLLIASFLTFLVLVLDLLLFRIMDRGAFTPATAGMVIRSLLLVLILFFLPSTALGTVSPVMAKYALEGSSRVGNTVGSIYAVSAIGSIVGTFLSGYVLIPLLGITTIVIVVGSLLALLALVMGRLRAVSLSWILLILVGLLLHLRSDQVFGSTKNLLYPETEGSTVLHRSDSRYSHIEVRDLNRGGRRERILIQDALIHNRYDPDAPDELLYLYEQLFRALTWRQAVKRAVPASSAAFRTLTLGAGGCVFPLFLERNYPNSENQVVEIDPAVLKVARDFFDLSENSSILQVVADARNYVAYLQGKERFEIIYLDAFNSYSIPYHLTTLEFTRQVAALLVPDGLVMANCIDIFDHGRFLNAYLNTMARVFPYTAVYADTTYSPQRRATFVIAAAFQPIGEAGEELYLDTGRRIGRRLSDDQLVDLRRRNGDGILSDNYAPVENLIAPVFLRSVD
ncbi:MAG: fused MFS/spermidine synthase [Spirochaetaceae bacterium]|nr:MAG: fused MFS/spermidine synthase [Spirochaetaceae bacterium]